MPPSLRSHEAHRLSDQCGARRRARRRGVDGGASRTSAWRARRSMSSASSRCRRIIRLWRTAWRHHHAADRRHEQHLSRPGLSHRARQPGALPGRTVRRACSTSSLTDRLTSAQDMQSLTNPASSMQFPPRSCSAAGARCAPHARHRASTPWSCRIPATGSAATSAGSAISPRPMATRAAWCFRSRAACPSSSRALSAACASRARRSSRATGIARRLTTPSYPSVGYTGHYDADIVVGELRALRRQARRIGGAGGDVSQLRRAPDRAAARSRAVVDATDFVDRIKAIKSAEERALHPPGGRHAG